MTNPRNRRNALLLALMIAGVAAIGADARPAAAETPRQLTIGTGSKTGVYFPSGRAICRMLARLNARKPGSWSCQHRQSAGSVANIEGIRDGTLDLGVVQSDVHFHAYEGSGKFKEKGPYPELRSLFSLHAEPFTVIARAGGGVWKLEQLKGRRINVGKKGSGPRETFFELLEVMGWSASVFAGFTQYDTREQPFALCDGRTDVITFVVGHPSELIRQAVERCNTILVNISGRVINKMLATRPYYRRTRIPAGLYRGANADVRTFGVSATVVTSTKLDTEAAYAVTQAVFENFEKFRSMHPALKYLSKADMAKSALTAPLHPGAQRYYEETGLR